MLQSIRGCSVTLSLLLVVGVLATKAQQTPSVVVFDQGTIEDALSSLIFGGCVKVSNVTYSGAPYAFGVAYNLGGQVGMDTALIMTTGFADGILGNASTFVSTPIGTSGDADLTSIVGFPTYDAAVLEFDFTPTSDTIYATTFTFGSEEYPEWVGSSFNDVFGFYISGPGINDGPINVAWLPGTNTPIAINSVNDQLNSQFFVDNALGTELAYDGLTVPIQLQYPVVLGETYHFRIVIADAGDAIFDSGVFLRSQSFCGNFWFQEAEFAPNDNGNLTYQFVNLAPGASDYLWDFGDGTTSNEVSPTHTYLQPGQYNVTLTASNACLSVSNSVAVDATVVGVDTNNSDSELNILPLGEGLFNVQFSASRGQRISARIADIHGRMMMEQDFGVASYLKKTLDLASLPQGIYLIEVIAGNTRKVAKVVR